MDNPRKLYPEEMQDQADDGRGDGQHIGDARLPPIVAERGSYPANDGQHNRGEREGGSYPGRPHRHAPYIGQEAAGNG